MTVSEVIRARRSIRRYKGEPVPQIDLERILEAAMCAPSSINTRPWEFAVVRNPELKKSIVEIDPAAKMLLQAPVGIVVVGRPQDQKPEYAFWPQDCGAAIENMLLEAAGLGYGTCWCGLYPIQHHVIAIRELLGLEPQSVPLAVVALGVPDEKPAKRGYFQPEKVKYFD